MEKLLMFLIYSLIQNQIDSRPLLVFYILIISVVFFIIYKRRKVNLEEKKKEIEKEQKKIIAKKQKEYNLLNQEKKVICDDGIERIYRANMFGIIKEKIDEQLICNGKNNPNILYSESPKMLTSYNDSYISLGMIYYNWYSETGKLLVFRTADEIIKADIKFKRKYDKYYYKYISNHKMRFNHTGIGSMVVINDFVFYQNFAPSLYVFSGKILGKKIVKGKLVDKS